MSWSDQRVAILQMTASASSDVRHSCSPDWGLRRGSVDFRLDVNRDFHRELTVMEVMSRVAGYGSSC